MSKVPCGGFKLDNNFLSMNKNGQLSLAGGSGEGEAFKQLVTDGDGNVKWEDRLAYEDTKWKDFTLFDEFCPDEFADIDGFTLPPVGNTITVKVNGIESVETVKSMEIEGTIYRYIGSNDSESIFSGANGWCVEYHPLEGISAIARPETNISLIDNSYHKIDEKYLSQDFVRPLSYYIGRDGIVLGKSYYNNSGDEVTTHKCSHFILPKWRSVFLSDSPEINIGKVLAVSYDSFMVEMCRFTKSSGMEFVKEIYGTDETDIASLAARYGYTLTTKPTT